MLKYLRDHLMKTIRAYKQQGRSSSSHSEPAGERRSEKLPSVRMAPPLQNEIGLKMFGNGLNMVSESTTSNAEFSTCRKSLRETEVRRRGTTSPDPEKIPEPPRGPLGGFPVEIPREEKKP